MIDLAFARERYRAYLKQFDASNGKIRLKIVHTEGVVRSADEITKRMGLSKEACDLAKLIALLHDIGRFEQLRLFDSFDQGNMDHAAYGVELLFGDAFMIRNFIKEDTYDDIIREAIAHHSDYILPDMKDPAMLLHARLIRDADKLDNCRVKLEDPVEVMLDLDADSVGALPITDAVWESCLRHESVNSADRVTAMDYWVSYIAYFYDINFKETWSIIREQNYLRRIADRIPYTHPETKDRMQKLEAMIMSWWDSRMASEVNREQQEGGDNHE